jgi:hypothetical protein
LSHFEQESYENAKLFGGFEQISSFFFSFFWGFVPLEIIIFS